MATTLKEKRDYLRTAAGFTAVALVAAGLIWLGNRNDAITEAERLKAGVLTAHQVKTAFEGVGGRIVARPHEESERVAAGDLIMAIDPTDVEIAIREAEAQIRSLDAQIAELEGTIELTLRTADTTERETWRRIEEAEAARRTTAADLENARLVYERAKRLRPSGAVSEADYDAAKSAFDAKRAALQGAERSVRALAVGADEKALAKLRRTGSAEGIRLSAVENARFNAENQRNTLANLHAARDAAAAHLDDLQVDRDRLTLEAPQAGKILELLFEEGEIVGAGVPVALLETDRRYVEIYVSEADAARYAPGAEGRSTLPRSGGTSKAKCAFARRRPSLRNFAWSGSAARRTSRSFA